MFVQGLSVNAQAVYANCNSEKELWKALKKVDDIYEFVKCVLKPCHSEWRQSNRAFVAKILVKLIQKTDIAPAKLREIGRLSVLHLGKVTQSKIQCPDIHSPDVKIYALALECLSQSKFVTIKSGVIDVKRNFFNAENARLTINRKLLTDPEQLRYAILLSRLFDSSVEAYLCDGVEKYLGNGVYGKYNLRIDERTIGSILQIAIELECRPLISKCLYYLNCSFLPISTNDSRINNQVIIEREKDLFYIELGRVRSEVIEKIAQVLSFFPPEKIWIRLSVGNQYAVLKEFISAFPDHIVEINNKDTCFLKRLPDLSALKNLKRVNLEDCPHLTFLPNLQNFSKLTYIRIKDCDSLIRAPLMHGSPEIRYLSFEKCSAMVMPPDLEGIENLRTLIFYRCTELIDIPKLHDAPSLENCTISSCPKISHLRCLLALAGVMLTDIPQAFSLGRYMDMSNDSIEYFCELIEQLTTGRPKDLEFIDDFLPIVERLILAHHWMSKVGIKSFSEMMEEIAQDPLIDLMALDERLRQSDPFQTMIPKALKDATFEEYVMAINAQIPIPADNCFHQQLYASSQKTPYILEGLFDNPNFEEIVRYFLSTHEGREVIAANKEKFFLQCPKVFYFILKQYPPSNIANTKFYPIICASRQDKLIVWCAHGHMQENPIEVLSLLAKSIAECSRKSKMHVSFYGQPGFDASGVTRDFLGLLCENLAVQLQFQTKIPDWTSDHDKIFSELGILFRFLLRTKIPVGESFSTDLFDYMLAFTHEEIQENFNKLRHDASFALYGNRLVAVNAETFKTVKAVKAILAWNGRNPSVTSAGGKKIIELIETQFDIFGLEYPSCVDIKNGRIADHAQASTYIELLKQTIGEFVIAPYVSRAHTAHAIAKGMKYRASYWKKLKAKGPFYLQNKILGELSKKKLKGAFEFRAGITEDLQTCFFEWIDKCEDVQLRNFVKYLTGAAVVPTEKIKVFMKEGIQGFEISTCFFQIDVPADLLIPAEHSEEGREYESLRDRVFQSLDYLCREESGFTLR